MKLQLQIQCNNAAFEDSCGDEVARLLREAAAKIEGASQKALRGFGNPLRDINGNRVGEFQFSQS